MSKEKTPKPIKIPKEVQEFYKAARQVTHKYPQYFILFADPKHDVVFGGYKNMFIPGHVQDKDKDRRVIQGALDRKDSDNCIDTFLLMIDGMLYNFNKTQLQKVEAKKSPKSKNEKRK